jgi:hypothetical protein
MKNREWTQAGARNTVSDIDSEGEDRNVPKARLLAEAKKAIESACRNPPNPDYQPWEDVRDEVKAEEGSPP